MNYRFRLEGELLVLQVGGYEARKAYSYEEPQFIWRDATIADIPVRDPFERDRSEPGISYDGVFQTQFHQE